MGMINNSKKNSSASSTSSTSSKSSNDNTSDLFKKHFNESAFKTKNVNYQSTTTNALQKDNNLANLIKLATNLDHPLNLSLNNSSTNNSSNKRKNKYDIQVNDD